MVQELLGHRNISTTQKYLGVNYADAKAAVEAIALITESDRTDLLYHSIKDIPSETLHRELRKRRYDPSRRDENHKTAGEVIKIS